MKMRRFAMLATTMLMRMMMRMRMRMGMRMVMMRMVLMTNRNGKALMIKDRARVVIVLLPSDSL
ncbi:hypothetical protein FGRA07_11292 [Fusarium graminearum]|nr:hypothetical protein FGRA07_11292 [Fusarium graminearum]